MKKCSAVILILAVLVGYALVACSGDSDVPKKVVGDETKIGQLVDIYIPKNWQSSSKISKNSEIIELRPHNDDSYKFIRIKVMALTPTQASGYTDELVISELTADYSKKFPSAPASMTIGGRMFYYIEWTKFIHDEPVFVTDENGENVTDENGEELTEEPTTFAGQVAEERTTNSAGAYVELETVKMTEFRSVDKEMRKMIKIQVEGDISSEDIYTALNSIKFHITEEIEHETSSKASDVTRVDLATSAEQ